MIFSMNSSCLSSNGLLAAERRFNLAFRQNERFLETVAVWRRVAAGWDVHIDHAKPSARAGLRGHVTADAALHAGRGRSVQLLLKDLFDLADSLLHCSGPLLCRLGVHGDGHSH